MEQLVPVELSYLERDENPGFEARCDVYAGFGASAAEALEALGESIVAGPPKPASPVLELGEAPAEPTSSPVGGAIDYDVLADKLFTRMKADEQGGASTTTTTTTPPAEPPAPAAS